MADERRKMEEDLAIQLEEYKMKVNQVKPTLISVSNHYNVAYS